MQVFQLTNTGMSYYNDMFSNSEYFLRAKGIKAEVVNMSPLQYFTKSAQIRGSTLEKETRITNINDVNEYAKKMKSGVKFHLPVLDYVGRTQEGRHRVLAAKQLKIKSVPVLVVKKASNYEIEKAHKKYMVKLYSNFKK